MRKKTALPPAETSTDTSKLADVVVGLTQQVRQLALILDEVREDLVWAVRNDKLNPVGASQKYVASYLPETCDDEETESDEEESSDDESPVPPPPVRETGSAPKNTQATLFS